MIDNRHVRLGFILFLGAGFVGCMSPRTGELTVDYAGTIIGISDKEDRLYIRAIGSIVTNWEQIQLRQNREEISLALNMESNSTNGLVAAPEQWVDLGLFNATWIAVGDFLSICNLKNQSETLDIYLFFRYGAANSAWGEVIAGFSSLHQCDD